ncbi:hypothetical protein B0H14DRAFT_2386265, partial [Mycena olivaceomarginata]
CNKALGCKDFAALVRTCKHFRGPALNFLWCEQETLANLLRCLSSHLIVEEPHKILRLSVRLVSRKQTLQYYLILYLNILKSVMLVSAGSDQGKTLLHNLHSHAAGFRCFVPTG